MYCLVSIRPTIIPLQNPNFIKYFNPICNFRLLIILFLRVLRLHTGIDLRGQVDCAFSKVNNDLGVGSAIVGHIGHVRLVAKS